MIVKPSFFKNEIYLPHARGSITDSVTDVEKKLVDFIDFYERDALEKCLGKLSIEFFKQLDESEPDMIKSGSDAKWGWLLNGHEYTRDNGQECIWKGIRRSRTTLGSQPSGEPDYSFLAEYIYFYYERNDFITRTDAGNAKNKAANAYMEKPSFKVVSAYQRFVDAVQGEGHYKTSWFKSGFLGGHAVDYRGFEQDHDVSLYQFINDMNEIDPDNYKDFNPRVWGTMNQFTI